MVNDGNNKIQNRIISRIIKKKRKDLNISAEELSLKVNKGSQYIYDIETNRKIASKDTIDKVFKELEIEFNEDLKIVDEVENLFYESLEYFFLNDKQKIKVLESIVDNNTYRFSYAHPIVVLCDYMLAFHNLEQKGMPFDEKVLANEIKGIMEDMNPVYKSTYYLFKGMYCFETNKLDESKQYLNIALEYLSSQSSNIEDGLKGCVHHYIGFLLAREYKLYDAEIQIKKALSYYRILHYVRRIIHAENTLALIKRKSKSDSQT